MKNTDARKKMAATMWIASATPASSKGALHKQLGIPQGTKIPVAKLKKAAGSKDELMAKRARLAITLRGFKH